MRRALTLLAILAFTAPVFAQNSRSESQTLRSNGVVALDVSGMGTASVTISGTYTATVSFRGYGDPNGDPQSLLCSTPATPGTTVSSTTSVGIWVCPVAGLRTLEAVVTGYASGAVKIYMAASPGGGGSAGSATFTGAITASSASDAATGAAVPAQASYTGLNIGGNLVGMTGFTLGSSRAGAVAIVDGSGAQITSFGGGSQYTTAAAVPTPTGTVALGWDGANVRAISTTAAGNLSVAQSGTWNITNAGTFAVQAAQSGTWNITNVSGTVSLPTGAATAAHQLTTHGYLDGLEGLIGTSNTALQLIDNIVSGSGVNISQIGGVAPSLGTGINGTGVLRVNEATDSALSSDTTAIRAAVEASATSLDTIQTNLSADAVQGNAVIATGPQKMLEAKDQDGSALPNSVTEGQSVRAAGSLNGVQYTMLVNEDGSAVGSVAQSGTWTMQPGNTANTTPWLTSLNATASAQGCTPGSIISAASVNETEIKGSAGQLYMLNVTNVGAAAVFFKIYNDTAANTDETDTPVGRFVIPGATTGAGNSVQVPAVGIVFSAGITFRITSAIADNSTGVIAANEVLVSYCYK